MRAAFSSARTIAELVTARSMLCLLLAASCIGVRAHQDIDPLDPLGRVVQRLPELPGEDEVAPGYLDIGEDGAELGYESRFEKWSASIDQIRDLDPNVRLDYGMQLTNKLGAGGRFTRQSSFSELVLNGIYAPQENVRLRLTGAQLREEDGWLLGGGDPRSGVLQNSYMLNARKYWRKYQYLSDLGVTAFSTQASGPLLSQELATWEQDRLPYGRKDGYMINLGLKPTAHSRLEMRREFSYLSALGDTSQATPHMSSRVKYSQFLDQCTRVQGGFSTGPESGRVDLNIARNNWSINLSREQAGDSDSTAIHLGYTIPLGARPSRSNRCAGMVEKSPGFEPIVDASVTRPPQLPSELLFTGMQ